MIKKIIVSISLLFSLLSLAQEATSSPYSYFGIGDIRFKGTVENRAMGSISLISDSTHVNLLNPAAYSGLKLTSFEIGGTYNHNIYKTYNQNESNNRIGLDYMSIGIPFKKSALATGLIPYSAVGYRINDAAKSSRYQGSGGVNKVFLGYAYNFNKKFSLGIDFQYNFGKIIAKSVFIPAAVYATREINTSYVSGLNIVAGLSYKTKINNKLHLKTGFTFTPESKLNLNNERSIGSVVLGASYYEAAVGDPTTDKTESKITLPSKYTFAAGLGDAKKWFVGTEYTYLGAANSNNRFPDIVSGYENASKIALGGYFVPNYKSYNHYYSRVVYRAGFRYEKTGLVLNNQSIKDTAITMGLGLPLMGTFSTLNIGVEYGAKGTIANSLVKQNYFNLSIGLSLSDRWFQKSKYD